MPVERRLPSHLIAMPGLVALLLIAVASGCASSGRADTGKLVAPPDPHTPGALLDAVAVADAPTAFARAAGFDEMADQATHRGDRMRLMQEALSWRRAGLGHDPRNIAEHRRYLSGLLQLSKELPVWYRRALDEYSAWWEAGRPSPLFAWLYAWTLTVMPTPEQLDTAQQVLAEALESAPGDYWLNYHMGMIAWSRDDTTVALECLGHAADVGPGLGQFDASYRLGQLHAWLGDYRAAVDRLEQVVYRDRTAGIEVYENLARMLANLGEFDRAKQLLLHDVPPQLAAVTRCRHLRTAGAIYLRSGDWRRAAWSWDTYLWLNPHADDFDVIARALAQLEVRGW